MHFRKAVMVVSGLGALALGKTAAAQGSSPVLIPVPPSQGAASGAPSGCTCSADLRWVTVRVRRANGTAIPDATLRVHTLRGRLVHTATQPVSDGSDEYIAAADGELKLRIGAAVSVRVDATWHGTRRHATLKVGTEDRCGCHVARVGPVPVITFP